METYTLIYEFRGKPEQRVELNSLTWAEVVEDLFLFCKYSPTGDIGVKLENWKHPLGSVIHYIPPEVTVVLRQEFAHHPD